MKITTRYNNYLLCIFIGLGQFPTIFFGTESRLNLCLFIERSTRLDFFFMYYIDAINYMILAYCLYAKKTIDKRLIKLVFILTILDFIHLFTFAMQGFMMLKFFIAFLFFIRIKYLLFIISEKIKKLWRNLL